MLNTVQPASGKPALRATPITTDSLAVELEGVVELGGRTPGNVPDPWTQRVWSPEIGWHPRPVAARHHQLGPTGEYRSWLPSAGNRARKPWRL